MWQLTCMHKFCMKLYNYNLQLAKDMVNMIWFNITSIIIVTLE